MRGRLEQVWAWIASRPAVFRSLPPNARWSLLGGSLVFVLGLLAVLLFPRPHKAVEPQAQAPATPPVPASATPPAEPVEAKPMPRDANVTFTVIPQVPEAWVSWGKKKLGRIAPRQPLVVTRPRDTGPLDVVVRAEGFFPVHTRAHTFSDNKVTVKLTPLDQQSTLLGYRVPIDAGADGVLDDLDAGMEGPALTP